MEQISCLLFDLDGTLLDSRELFVDTVYETIEQYLPGTSTRGEMLQRFGESFQNCVESFQHLLAEGVTQAHVWETYENRLQANYEEKIRIFPQVKAGLEILHQAGYCLGIVTNKQRAFAERDLQRFDLEHLFDAVVTLDDVTEGKPSAEPVIKAMNEIGALPERTLFVGDSHYDVAAAKAAQVKSVVLHWYTETSEGVVEPKADYRFLSFQQFTEALLTVKSIGHM